MNKISTTIYITTEKIEIKNNKIFTISGEFYFQGKKYKIENGEIVKKEE